MDLRIVLVASAALPLNVGCNKEEKASGGAVGASRSAGPTRASGRPSAASGSRTARMASVRRLMGIWFMLDPW